MKVFIFTEGGSNIGYGHISRCSSLYDEFEKESCDVTFVITGDIDVSSTMINKNVVKCNWHNINSLSKININNSICIVDSYIATIEIYKYIKSKCKTLLCVDDYNRLPYTCNYILNPIVFDDIVTYNNREDVKVLMGNEYVILRSDFNNIDTKSNDEINEILITLGGSDIRNLTPTVYNIVKTLLPNTKVNVVMGKASTNINEVKKLVKKEDNFYINLDANEMKNVMEKSDIAISASGQTTLELIRVVTPFVPIQIIDNQENIMNGYLKNNFINEKIIWDDFNFEEKLIKSLKLLLDLNYRKNLENKYKSFIDGNGAKRIVKILLK